MSTSNNANSTPQTFQFKEKKLRAFDNRQTSLLKKEGC